MATRAVIGYYLTDEHTVSAKSPWKGVYVHHGDPTFLGETLFSKLVESDSHVKTLIDTQKCGFSVFPIKPYDDEDCNYFTNKSIDTIVRRSRKNYVYEATEITGIGWLYLFNTYEKKLNIFKIKLKNNITSTKDEYIPVINLVESISYFRYRPIDWEKISRKH